MMQTEHPFAQYVRILGKGKRGSRSLTYDEAYHAFSMILKDEVDTVQVGAFLVLLRMKEESATELHAFVQASKDQLKLPTIQVDLDWSSYAGKRKHYPWFLLAALTLAKQGIRIFMHGAAGHTHGRLYTEAVLPMLGFSICHHVNDVQAALDKHRFAYMPLGDFSPKLAQLIELRYMLGLRSPAHTLARLLNPFNATTTIQAIFHPAYRISHQQAAQHLGYLNAAVIKGEGGEFERNPDANTLVLGIQDGVTYQTEWDMLNDVRSTDESTFDLDYFKAVWQGSTYHAYGEKAVLGTLAIILIALKKSSNQTDAMLLATQMWNTRHSK